MNKYLFLFIQFFKIALFVVGGGLAMLPVIEQIFVEKHHLISEEDFVDMVALTQTIPGLIAINSSIFIGYKIAGFMGAVVAVFGVLLPSLVILSLIAAFFPLLNLENDILLRGFDFVRATVAGLLGVMLIRQFKKIVNNIYIFILVFLLTILLIFSVKVVYVILLSLILGVIYVIIESKNTNKGVG